MVKKKGCFKELTAAGRKQKKKVKLYFTIMERVITHFQSVNNRYLLLIHNENSN